MPLPESHIPGSFILDSPVPPKLDLAGAKSHFYRSPQTPSATSSLYRSVGSSKGKGSRKRIRFGYDDGDEHATASSLFDDGNQLTTSVSDLGSPAPLLNSDYHFQSGLGRPQAMDGQFGEKRVHDYGEMEIDRRPSRYRDFSMEGLQTPQSNTRKRSRGASIGSPSTQENRTGSNGWGKAVINVACKVWDFCWSGPFRGFYAGGGRGYQMEPTSTVSLEDNDWHDVRANGGNAVSTSPGEKERMGTPIPGQFPEDGDTLPRPKHSDPLRSNWVMVRNDPDPEIEERSTQPPRKAPRRNSTVHIVSPRRANITRLPRRQSLTPGRPPGAHRASLGVPASYGSPKSGSPTKSESPASLEAQRFAAKARRREKEEDASIRRLNQQLKAMIREGKEALGTRIEIDEDDWE